MAVQPDYDKQAAHAVIATHAAARGALLPMLHALQRSLGFVPDDLVPDIAQALNVSRADVHGVITFYHDFRHQPAGRHVVKLCRAEACQSVGAVAVAEHARFGAALWVGWWTTVSYLLGTHLVEILEHTHKYKWWAIAGIALCVTAYVTLHVRHVRRRRARAAEEPLAEVSNSAR